MDMLSVRNLPDEVHRALRVQATLHGRSTEAEARAILEESVLSERRTRLGSLLTAVGERVQLTDEELANFTQREARPGQPIDLG